MAYAAFIVASTIFYTILTHSVILQADEWDSFSVYKEIVLDGHPWITMFNPHNEHRIFFPRLVFFFDYFLLYGQGIIDKVVIVAIQALEACLFCFLMCRCEIDRVARGALAAVVVVLLFSLYQSENFEWAFQVQFVGVFACASLGITMFAMGLTEGRSPGRSGLLMAAAYGLAAVASLSMANGLLTGPVLAVMACLARARARTVLGAGLLAGALMASYGLGSRAVDAVHGTADPWGEAIGVAMFTAGYLGNFLDISIAAAVAFGSCGLLALAAMTAWIALGRDRSMVGLALLGIALFAAGSAFLTAVGRVQFGLGGLLASRYSTGAAVFWAATLINGWRLAGRLRSRFVWRACVCASAALLLAMCWTGQEPAAIAMERRTVDYNAMADAMLLDLFDRAALDAFEEPVDKAREMAPALRRLGLSVFAGREARLVGRPLSEVEGVGAAPLPCAGGFATAVDVPELGSEGVAVAGTSSLRRRFGGASRVYIVDADRRIAGFAHTGFAGDAWTGYARAPAGARLHAYALSGSGRTCDLGSTVVSGRGSAPGGARAEGAAPG